MQAVTNRKKGFTLLEVVIALAVFAFLIGGLLGFLPWSIEGVGQVKDQSIAYGLVDAVDIELDRLGFSLVEAGTNRIEKMFTANSDVYQLLLVANRRGGAVVYEQIIKRNLEILNTSDPKEGENVNFLDKTEITGRGKVEFNLNENKPISLFAFTDEHKIDEDFSSRWIPESERYFLIKCTQFDKKDEDSTTDIPHRLRHDPSNGYLALQIDIQWPYKIPDPSQGEDGFRRVAEKYRKHFRFPLAIVR